MKIFMENDKNFMEKTQRISGSDYFLKVVTQNDRNFVEVIRLYMEAGIDYYLPKVFSPPLKVVVKTTETLWN